MTASHEPATETFSAPLIPGAVLQNRYRIVRQLGRGGMGAVYEAEDQRLGITIALKETLSTEASMLKQFEHEARLLAGMQHPALPRVSDHFVEGNRAFLVMEFIGGVDLARIISQQPGPFPRDQVIAWADQLLDALMYLHSRDRQVIHRDIKPHNLKLTATGQIALLDFGLAKAQPSDPSVTASQAFFGYTLHYAPLEQIQDHRTDPRSDIYALGATLYHLLTGIKPPDAMVRAAALINSEPDPLKPANQIHEAVGPQIAVILNTAMAQKPEKRFANASEFREALRRMGRTSDAHPGVGISVGVQPPRETIHVAKMSSALVAEAPVLEMALVGSAKRFGPAVFTAILVIVLTLAAGILYGSQRWFQSPAEIADVTSANIAAAQRQSAVARKTERPRDLSSTSVVPARAITESDNNGEKANRENEAPSADSASDSKGGSGLESEATQKEPRKVRNKVDAPSIRLPNPDVTEDTAALSPDDPGIRAYGSNPPPQFFRAADGTLIVRFSDGSTRIVRPGERSAQ